MDGDTFSDLGQVSQALWALDSLIKWENLPLTYPLDLAGRKCDCCYNAQLH